MSQQFNIRTIQPSDFLKWHSLRLLLWHEGEEDADLLSESYAFFQKNTSRQQVFLAENEQGEIVGFIETNIRQYAEGCETGNVGFIEGWFVLAEFRQQNIGKKLVEAAEKWAKEMGCTEMASDALIDNDLSIEAHKKLGFEEVERIVCFRKDL